jgi:hypothetical protein
MAGVWADGAPFGTLGSEDPGTDDFWSDGAPEGGLPELGDSDTLSVIAADAATVTESGGAHPTPMMATVFETVAVTPVFEPEPLDGRRVRDLVTVTEFRRIGRNLGKRPTQAVTVTENVWVVFRVAERLTKREPILVRESVRLQAYINGGLGVRVSETITVAENPMYLGYAPVAGGPGNPDYTTLNVGPNPGMSLVDLGTDYWLAGV